MSVIAIIPARYASTRLPGKPLLDRTGKTLIQHVVESVARAGRVQRVVVATDDQRIFDAVAAFGGQAVMTSIAHRSGTDRLNEAAAKLHLADDDVVVNVQGDEPDIPPACVDELVGLLETCATPMATLCTPLEEAQADNPNRVKVVFGRDRRALYFSRSRIPFDRDAAGNVRYYLHLGIYAYRTAFLRLFAGLSPTPAEEAEKLEQLRALEHGHAIAVACVNYDGAGIDTPADYEAFVKRMKNQ